jgi:prophage antirepressor-like protein
VEALAKIFDFEGSPVRTVLKDGEPWFVAKDVCEVLGCSWDGHRLDHVPPEWKGAVSVTTPGGTQDATVLSEQGLYFFLSRSDKPKALPFQKWVSGNVLPKIRREGMYLAPALNSPEDQVLALAQAITISAQAVKELRAKVDQQGQTLSLVKETFAAHPDEWRKTIKDGIDKIAVTQNKFFQFVWGEFYDLLEERGHCDLKIRLKHVRARMAAQGISKSKIADVNRLDTLEEDPVLQELALAIVKEMVAKYAA